MEPRPSAPSFLYPGQPVRRRDDPPDRLGHIVGIIFAAPSLALVRWRDEAATFEPLEALVEVVQRLL
jgi:hypothetical protein